VGTKKRNFYNKDRLKHPNKITPIYVLKCIDPKNNEIINLGPYANKQQALAEQNAKLLNGICSWLVVYNEQ
jgi:hypothetical protein